MYRKNSQSRADVTSRGGDGIASIEDESYRTERYGSSVAAGMMSIFHNDFGFRGLSEKLPCGFLWDFLRLLTGDLRKQEKFVRKRKATAGGAGTG